MNKEYALVRFTTRTGRVLEVMTAKVKSMLKLMALNRATKSCNKEYIGCHCRFGKW